jgi:hypothetical protein
LRNSAQAICPSNGPDGGSLPWLAGNESEDRDRAVRELGMAGGQGIDADGKKPRHASGVRIKLFPRNVNCGARTAVVQLLRAADPQSPYRAPEWHHPLDEHGQPLDGPPKLGRRPSRFIVPVPAVRKKASGGQASPDLETYTDHALINEIRGNLLPRCREVYREALVPRRRIK